MYLEYVLNLWLINALIIYLCIYVIPCWVCEWLDMCNHVCFPFVLIYSDFFSQYSEPSLHACHCTDLNSKIELSKIANLKEVGVGLKLEY